MSNSEKPLVYLILGATGSGRREVLADLITDGLEESDRPAVLLPESEPPTERDAKLPGVARWTWLAEGMISSTLPKDATHVFFVVDGRRNPIDQTEAFKAWLEAQGGEIGRVICVVNSQLMEKHPALLAWYEACVHFSDVVLLNKREGVENKAISDFLNHFKKLYYPCHFELLREGQVKNPALILQTEARRMTHVFDEEQDWIFTNADGEEIDEQEETEDGEDEIEAKQEEDPYFVRHSGGRRVKEIPNIAKYLDMAEPGE
ncbi:MAG: hypothetical protein V4773_25495 [Verrucomicrobiota bacterium]